MNMHEFYGTKRVRACLMTLGAYNELQGWTMPEGQDPKRQGYLVEYIDSEDTNHPDFEHYISWSPAETFEAAYQQSGDLSFGHAVVAMEAGLKVSRRNWNGKDMFLYMMPAAHYPASRNEHGTLLGRYPNDMVPYRAQVNMVTAQNDVVAWTCSQSDMLAHDWYIVE